MFIIETASHTLQHYQYVQKCRLVSPTIRTPGSWGTVHHWFLVPGVSGITGLYLGTKRHWFLVFICSFHVGTGYNLYKADLSNTRA